MSPIAVVGAGSWGTALAILLAHAGRSVTLWAHNENHLSAMRSTQSNERYLPNIKFPSSLSVARNNSLDSLAQNFDDYLVVVPSHAFRELLVSMQQARQKNGKGDTHLSLLWGTKGFDAKTGEILSNVAQEIFQGTADLALITGPSFAKETALGMPTALVLACEDMVRGEQYSQWFRTSTTRVYPNTDLIGAQIGGAVKNVMAIAAGISDGLGFGANARAALITRGLLEINRLGQKLGGKTETFMGLAGMGDLVLTCTDDQSRNRRLGLGVGKGQAISQVIKEIGQEVEGFNAAKELYHRAQTLQISMPITEQVYAVLHQKRDPKLAVKQLLERQPKAES